MKRLMQILCFFFASMSFAETQIVLNWKAEPQFGGFYQAALNKEIPLKILEGGSGTPTVQMLSFGKVDFAVISAEEILISNEKNPQNQVVALLAVFQTNPQAWITLKSRGLNSIGEIMSREGIVAAQTGLTYVQFLKKKYPQAQVKWVPYTGGISGLTLEKNYTQQGFITSEPLLAEKQGLAVSSFLIANEGFNPYTTVLAVRKSDLVTKKKEILKVVLAVKKGWEDYLKNPEPANKMMGKINKSMGATTFKKSAEAQKSLIETSVFGMMKESRWQELIGTLVELKVLKNTLPASAQFEMLY
jgi:NitT/TauT family transport system substrate-binding protein